MTTTDELTTLLRKAQSGDASARDRVVPVIYPEIRRIAARLIRKERRDHTLQATELAHEVWMEVFGGEPLDITDRQHFYALVATAMRRMLIDYARRRLTVRHGAGFVANALRRGSATDRNDRNMLQCIVVDQLLSRLDGTDPGLVKIVELRYFLGLTVEETAFATGLATSTVRKLWSDARRIFAELLGLTL